MGMLQQQEVVVAGAGMETPLQGQSVAVLDPAEPADAQHGLAGSRHGFAKGVAAVLIGCCLHRRRTGRGSRHRAQRISASQSRVSMISLTR